MRRSKVFVGFLIGCLVCLAVSPLAFAVVNLFYSEPTALYDGVSQLDSVSYKGRGFVVTGNNQFAKTVTFYFGNLSTSAVYEMKAKIYNASGGKPVVGEQPIEVSDLVTVAPVSYVAGHSGAELVDGYSFQFAGTTFLSSSKSYAVVVMINGFATGDVRVATSSAAGTGCYYDTSAWQTYNTRLLTYFFTDDGLTAAPTATPFGISTGLFSSDLMWYIVALILLLTPPFILGVFMRGGKWGFLLGIAIGTGVARVVVPNVMQLWLVILIAIGLGAAFLGAIREGG